MDGAGLLYPPGRTPEEAEADEPPECFRDLGLDRLMEAMTAGREEYRLRGVFCRPLGDEDAVRHRQQVMRDLEDEGLRRAIERFSRDMRDVRRRLAQSTERYHPLRRQREFLDAAEVYCGGVRGLAEDLERFAPVSDGLRAFRETLRAYLASETWTVLARETETLEEELSKLSWVVHLRGNRVTVSLPAAGEIAWCPEIRKVFDRFSRPEDAAEGGGRRVGSDMNPVEENILDRVARLYPGPFERLANFCARHENFPDPTLTAFEREIQFYLAWREFIDPFRRAGLPFCLPEVSPAPQEIRIEQGFELTLAGRLLAEGKTPVRNDLLLKGRERIVVVTGPNQGGKTTFAKMIGQVHYLAALGVFVPAGAARLLLFDRLSTLFQEQERMDSGRGKLQDDLLRVRGALERATPRSILVFNEIFSSTSLADAIFLGRRILQTVRECGSLCVCVTFVDEWAAEDGVVVSLVAAVDAADPTIRTYRVERRPADGRSYALSIAEKYGLNYETLKSRIRS